MNQSEDQTPFLIAVEKITEIFSQYKIEDIACSLFISCVWLPNIASSVQHQLLVAIFVSLNQEQFTGRLGMDTYTDFHQLLEKLYPLLPSFPFQEDFVPSPDWGSVKYHLGEEDFKFFYGTDLENLYDTLQLFEIVYGSYNDEFLSLSGYSPNEELYSSLLLQDTLISSLNGQPDKEKLGNISPGYKEIPPEKFWSEASNFYTNFIPQELLEQSFLEKYSQQIGQFKPELSSQELFEGSVFEGKLLPFIFLRYQERFFLILPRRVSEVVHEDWSHVFTQYRNEICGTDKSYFTRLSGEVYKYLKFRISNEGLYGLTNAVDSNNNPHETLFAASVLAKNRLVMIYVAEPFTKSEEISKHLQDVAPKLVKALALIKKPPVSLGLNIEKQIVQFKSRTRETLAPMLIVVLPQITSLPTPIRMPASLPATFFFLDQFLGVFDELDNSDELVSFVEYFKEVRKKVNSPFTGMLDYFASFRGSHGVLVSGASKPDLIVLDPHWGSDMRYESLSEFWSLYPDVGFVDHPKSWKLIRETDTRVRLEARGYFGSALYTKIGETIVFITAPFEHLAYEQGLITALLMESLEDSLSRLKNIIDNHQFFHEYKRLQVIFFPSQLTENDRFKHISHLKPDGVFWRSDRGHPRRDWPGVRIVVDTEALYSALEQTKDNNIEIDLLLEILNHVNAFMPDSYFDQMIEQVNKQRGKLPRFMTFQKDKEVAFPEFIPIYKPETHDYKRASNKIAELAVALDIKPGEYELERAKEMLNQLRRSVVNVIQTEVLKYDMVLSIPYLIERIDALEDDHHHQRVSLHQSMRHEVDYERDESYSDERREFLRYHKNFRYLIEKFVQLDPHGRKRLTQETFQYLVALVDQLHGIYFASDSLHYNIYPVGITITDDYLVSVNYSDDLEAKQEIFSREQAKISLGELGIESDRVETPGLVDEYIHELDEAFTRDLGFGFKNLVAVLTVLSQWAGYDENSKLSTYYAATEEKLTAICQKSIIDLTEAEAKRIIKFLVLQSTDVIRVSGQTQPCDDIPVWEYRKRYSRYNLRPLLFLNRLFYWGAYSAKRAEIIWSHVPLGHALPADLSTPSVDRVLVNKHRLIEQEIEDKVLDIVKRYTSYAEGNIKLHQRDKEGKHPAELGDYDVLAFLPGKNIILNIECKEISPAFCAKDSKRIREKIFGRVKKENGYLEKVEKRESYIRKNIKKIIKIMGFPPVLPESVQTVSIFVSRDLYWWMKYPPRPTNVIFLRTDLLAAYLDSLVLS